MLIKVEASFSVLIYINSSFGGNSKVTSLARNSMIFVGNSQHFCVES